MNSYSPSATIRTVAAREMGIAVRSKGIIITLALAVIIVIAGIGAMSYFKSKDDPLPQLVVVGLDASTFSGVDTSSVNDRAEAEQRVRDGADAALIKTDQGYDLLADGQPDPQIMAIVTSATSSMAHDQALRALDVDPAAFTAALPPSAINTIDISDDASDENMGAIVMVMLGVSLMSFFIMLFAGNIGGRVTEEKSSWGFNHKPAMIRLIRNDKSGFVWGG